MHSHYLILDTRNEENPIWALAEIVLRRPACLGSDGKPTIGEHAKAMLWVNEHLGRMVWFSAIPDVPWNPPLRVAAE